MSKTVLLCTLFAGLGAVGAIALTQWPATTHVAAQVPGERSAEPGDHVVATEQTAQRSDPDHPMARPVVERDDFTPEERVNIRVYEDVNRGVVNITTRVRREDNFNSFFFK